MNQFRCGNKSVMDFFNKQRVAELIGYITIVPNEEDGHDRCNKFPFLANQVFSDGEDGVSGLFQHFFYSEKEVQPRPSPIGKAEAPLDANAGQDDEPQENEAENKESSDQQIMDNAAFLLGELGGPSNDDEIILKPPPLDDDDNDEEFEFCKGDTEDDDRITGSTIKRLEQQYRLDGQQEEVDPTTELILHDIEQEIACNKDEGSPAKVKKSFESYKTDDDEEIEIVEGEDDGNSLEQQVPEDAAEERDD
mmetsp:Transcript_15898/g.24501  ORF Transcript_15898/g.24501 Transcript_15898/m.24501 type:complete len:250 (+) Transcript_15898:158-907(+)